MSRTVQTASEFVRVEVDSGIATIRIDRPKMNPLSIEVQDALAEAARIVTADDEVAAVVIYGGEKVFAAGADIKEMQTMGYTDMVQRASIIQDCFTQVARIPKPVIAAIEGYALGAGNELAMCADFRVAAADAKLGQPEILLGVIPGAGGTQRLARLVGVSKAKDLVYTGRMIDAAEAQEIGLVDKVAEPGEAYATAVEMAQRYVHGPAFALRAAKETIDRGLDGDLATGLAIEAMQFAGVFATQDREIGMTSFVKEGPGKATFEGR
ncbi:enoyl-CoA hydratase/isomerase family protein [Ornithinimicrobium pratense]|uniref:enoyl-CoA hydratase n=1 Tax=Ornithinimicrobium pratense TaxID=2593973 RepID=A0A5J6V2C4_9MICO|nr:enoyl-CoA hydratase-related protein [Ornithinimicrobium pratense]QFG67855.1 enoyl-CoA hydratase/isomerase family protein [Ornithinimicrobium pratense]